MQYIEKIKQDYDRLKKNGPYATLAQNNKGGPKSRYVATVFDKAVLPFFSEASHEKVLDFGCAAGILSNKLAPITKRTIGVDISSSMLQLAIGGRSSDGRQSEYIQIDGKRLPFKDYRFTSVVAREALCHIIEDDFPKLLTEINRVLNNEGLFYLIDQVSESPHWRLSEPPMTIKRSVTEIIDQAKNCGFESVDAYVVRQPRTVWIYLFWLNLLPDRLMPILAKMELLFNKHFVPIGTKRWHNVMFIFRKSNNKNIEKSS